MGIEHYTRLRDLGGSNGAFLACDRQDSSRKVVIKRLAEGQEGMTELNLSLRARHPHIVKMLEFFIHDGELYGVIKYEEGGDLASLLRRLRELAVVPKEVTLLRWFVQLLSALQFCHEERRIIHRDIKPDNIFLSSDDKQLFLGDFGSAKALTGGASMTSTFVGSPMWISPEVLLGRTYTFSSDVWSLGCVFFEMATLRHPFHAHNFAHLVTKVTSGEVATLPDAVPVSVRAIITKMLRFEPTERASARDLLQEALAALPAAEASEMASRRNSTAQVDSSPTVHSSSTRVDAPPEASSSAASSPPQRPPASTSHRPSGSSSAVSSHRASPATPPPAHQAASPSPPPDSGLRTCTPTQQMPSDQAIPPAPAVPTRKDAPQTQPTRSTVNRRVNGGGAVASRKAAQPTASRQPAPIPDRVVASAEPLSVAGVATSPGRLRRQIEERLKHRRDSDSDSDASAPLPSGAAFVEAREPLQLQGRRLSLGSAEFQGTAALHAQTSSRSGGASLTSPSSRASASAGREKRSAAGEASSKPSASSAKAPAMRQRWYDRTPTASSAAGKHGGPSTRGHVPTQRTSYHSAPAVAAVPTVAPVAAKKSSSPESPRTPSPASPSPPQPASADTPADLYGSESGPGAHTWLAQYSDEATDIEQYLRKFRAHDDAVLRTYDERQASPNTVKTPSPPQQPLAARATPQRERQPSRRANAAAATGASSPPRVPRRKNADTPVSIIAAGGGVVYKAPPPQPPLPLPPQHQQLTRAAEVSPSPKSSAVRARASAGSALRRQKVAPSASASPNAARYFSPKYERQPSALRAPIVESHHPRQASHARPQPHYTENEKRALEAERREAKERREADRERMKEMIKAQRSQQKRRNSVDVEIKLPDHLD